jgi:hypothetical protein
VGDCEAFLHTFNMKICTHKTRLEVELLCSCSLTSKVVQYNAMKFTKNLMRCVHLEDIKTFWENRNSPWWNVKGHYLDVHSMSRLMVEPLLYHSSYTTRNFAFCNCLMQLVSSCMRHMQLEIRPVAYDKLHEICSCMRQSYNTSTYGWVIRFHPPILYTSSWSCDCMQLQGLRSHCITC